MFKPSVPKNSRSVALRIQGLSLGSFRVPKFGNIFWWIYFCEQFDFTMLQNTVFLFSYFIMSFYCDKGKLTVLKI